MSDVRALYNCGCHRHFVAIAIAVAISLLFTRNWKLTRTRVVLSPPEIGAFLAHWAVCPSAKFSCVCGTLVDVPRANTVTTSGQGEGILTLVLTER